jgi:cardiolipin synthase
MDWLRVAFAAALVALGGCTMPVVDRNVLEEARATPVRVENARGPLSYTQSQAILADLKKRSPETSIFDRHLAVEESVAGSPLSIGNRATLLEDGAATYPAMLAAIKSARKTIHLEVYIFDDGPVAQEFADALIERAKKGVTVRVIYDSVGSNKTSPEFFDLLAKSGVQVLAFSPVAPANILKKGAGVNQRNHRKLLVVDSRVAFLGGINISEVYAGTSGPRMTDVPFDERAWRDTQLQVEGPVVNDFQKSFMAVWEREKKEKLPEAELLPQQKPVGALAMRAIEGNSDGGFNPVYVTFISAIASAESEIHITMAYFVPDVQLVDELKAAARRGVDVKLVLPSRTDGWVVFHAGRSFYDDLLEAGVKIYERKNRLLHSKYAVVDGVWSTVGSSNLDWRSLLHNLELNAVILGPEFGGRLEALFQKDVSNSSEITREKWAQRPIQDRLREAAARSWAYLL